jgi:hypothetical protein
VGTSVTFVFAAAFRPGPGNIEPPILSLPRTIPKKVSRQEREADKSLSSVSEVKIRVVNHSFLLMPPPPLCDVQDHVKLYYW